MKRNNDENVTVKLNLRLHDGVRFKAEVTADLMKRREEVLRNDIILFLYNERTVRYRLSWTLYNSNQQVII